MLGEEISDPDGAEQRGTVPGLGLLPVRTVFQQEKRRTRVQGRFLRLEGMLEEMSGARMEGYEIHMGESFYTDGETSATGVSGTHNKALVEFTDETASGGTDGLSALCTDSFRADGAQCGNVYGCYVHGIFDAPEAAKGLLTAILKKKGYDPDQIRVTDWKAHKEEQYDRLADIIRSSLDMEEIYKIIQG